MAGAMGRSLSLIARAGTWVPVLGSPVRELVVNVVDVLPRRIQKPPERLVREVLAHGRVGKQVLRR